MALATNVVNSTQPAFLYILGSNVSNVTGDATQYTLGAGTALTQVFDQGSNMTTGGTFTAPVTGRYYFTVTFTLSGTFAAGMTSSTWRIITTGRTFLNTVNAVNCASGGGLLTVSTQVICPMTSTDTATFQCQVSGGTKVISAAGTATQEQTFVSGYLVC